MANIGALASDADSKEFQGAINPDQLLHVRFYSRACPNAFKTLKEARPIFDDVMFIAIHTPGNTLNIIDRPMKDDDKRRFPLQWAHYANTHSNDPTKQGTPLEQWPLLQPSQVAMLRAVQFFTVEQVAFASDEQIGKIGMIAGMQPMSLRDRAKGYLAVAKDTSILQKQADENKALHDEIGDLKKQMADLMATLGAKTAPDPVPIPVNKNTMHLKKTVDA